MGNILKIENIFCGYHPNIVLNGISFSVNEGEFLGIIGPNGSGKTTLFRSITRLIKLYSGTIFYKNRNIGDLTYSFLAKEIGVVGQHSFISFSYTVKEFVSMGRYPYLKRLESLKKYDKEIIENAIKLMDITHLINRTLNELSSGELQRVNIAQVLAQEPSLILLDEPTSHLDIGHQIEILDLIKELNKKKDITIITILHDLNLASEYCDRLILLKEGKIFSQGLVDEVIKYDVIEKVYNTVIVVIKNPVSKKPYVVLVPKGVRS